jgi:ribokinase
MGIMTISAFGLLNIDIIYSGVNALPKPGEEIYYPNFDIQLGGGSVLAPIVMNHFGVKSKLGTFISNDLQGDLAKKLLKKLNFNQYYNFYKKGNGAPIIVTSAVALKDDRCFISYGDAITDIDISNDDVYNFLKGSFICFAVPQYPKVMEKLQKEGTIIIYDFGWEDDMHISQYENILKYVDIYTPNDKEAMKLTDTNSPQDAIVALGKYVKQPIVKVGKDGCMTLVDNKIVHVAMPCEFNAMDTTGAGDNFLAGIIYGLYNKMPILESMKVANVFGGVSTTKLGCYSGIMSITNSDIEKYLRMY